MTQDDKLYWIWSAVLDFDSAKRIGLYTPEEATKNMQDLIACLEKYPCLCTQQRVLVIKVNQADNIEPSRLVVIQKNTKLIFLGYNLYSPQSEDKRECVIFKFLDLTSGSQIVAWILETERPVQYDNFVESFRILSYS